jgi:hypothetical protein
MSKDLIMLELGMLESDYEESGIYEIGRVLSNTIQKLIADMKSYITKLKNDCTVMYAQIEKNKRFKELKALVNTPEGKNKKFYFLNIPGAVTMYQDAMKQFTKELDKIIKKSYATYSDNEEKQLSYKIDEFNDELEEFDEDLEKELNKRIVKRGYEALEYIQHIEKGTDPIYKYYFNLVRTYENFKADAERKLQHKAIDTDDEIRKFGGMNKVQVLLRKTSNKASKGARRILIKAVWWTS